MVRESHSSSKKSKDSVLIVVNDSIWKNQSFNSEPKHKIKFGKKHLRSPKFYSKIEQELSKNFLIQVKSEAINTHWLATAEA